jgi:type III pantothenate kinase
MAGHGVRGNVSTPSTSGASDRGKRILTLDAGNGALKAALWSTEEVTRWCTASGVRLEAAPTAAAPEPLRSLRLEWGADDFDARLTTLLADAASALVSNVGGPARALQLAVLLGATSVRDATAPHGLDLSRCRSVHTIGADRLWAARGAFERTGRSCLVVDAGTAVTIDAVVVATDRRSGVAAFAGGAIALGPELAARALGAGGEGLFEVDVRRDPSSVPALGRESEEALRAGVVHGVRGAIRELVELVRTEAQLADEAPRLVTGGAAALLLAEPSAVGVGAHHEPWLVHLGLLAAHARSGVR